MDRETKAQLDEELETEKEQKAEEEAFEVDKVEAMKDIERSFFVDAPTSILEKEGPITLDDIDEARAGRNETDIPMTDDYWEVLARFRHGR